MTESEKAEAADILVKALGIMCAAPSLATLVLAGYARHVSTLSRYDRDCIAENFDDMRADPKSLEMLAGMIRRASK